MGDTPNTSSNERSDAGRFVGRTTAPRPAPGRGRLPSWVIPALVLTLVAGFGIGLAVGMLTGGGSEQAAPTTTSAASTTTTVAWEPADAYGAAVTVGGSALPMLDTQTAGAVDTAVGMAFPALSGTDYAGNARSIAADGRPKLIVALAHWCPYCNQEVPHLNDWYAAGVPEGVDVIAMSVYADPSRDHFPPAAWVQEAALALPLIADDESRTLVRTLGIAAVPYWVLVAADGTVAGRATGQRDAAGIDQFVQALLGQG